MKNMDLSENEVKLIEEFRLNLELKKPKKIGYAKHDIYHFVDRDVQAINHNEDWTGGKFISKKEMKIVINCIKENCFELIAQKGTKFLCYTHPGQSENWYNAELNMYGMSGDWAELNLENITKID